MALAAPMWHVACASHVDHACAGHSRAVIARNSGAGAIAVQLTFDAKPEHPDEMARIQVQTSMHRRSTHNVHCCCSSSQSQLCLCGAFLQMLRALVSPSSIHRLQAAGGIVSTPGVGLEQQQQQPWRCISPDRTRQLAGECGIGLRSARRFL